MFERARARLLVVDDEASVRFTLEEMLRRNGYDVTTAANGEEALGWLMQQPFDLVLIDLCLPGISGRELAHYVRRCQPAAATLFVTGNGDFDEAPVAKQIGGVELVPKSAGPAVLDQVAKLLAG